MAIIPVILLNTPVDISEFREFSAAVLLLPAKSGDHQICRNYESRLQLHGADVQWCVPTVISNFTRYI